MTHDRPHRMDFEDRPPSPGGIEASSANAENEDPRLLHAVQEYFTALEAGSHPRRQEWLERYPDIAVELSVYLDGLSFVHSAAGQVLGGSGLTPAALGVDAETEAGRPLGDFRLLREIGRGGMGVVYEAVQLSLDRRFAVKVLPLASSMDSRRLQRFRHEAQAAAQLHHTNIVPVYAVGCERSVHFYAMQLIEGQSLADVIAALRAEKRGLATPVSGQEIEPARPDRAKAMATTSGSYEVPPSEASHSATAPPTAGVTSLEVTKGGEYFRVVARLGLQAADALEYAHAVGVVHRDIKPANLLLDHAGTLWVTDFGLAQIYIDVSVTQPGDLVGTLRYMSPEQASGSTPVLDARTDIYSLGVTLYELLTLRPALPGETREALLRQIGSEDPRPPRSINRAVPLDLQTVVAKATAKDAADRYSTARALADDLRRFLRDEPIRARPPSLRDRAVKWTRRHRAMAASAVTLLMLAAIGFSISTVMIAREQGKTRIAYEQELERAADANRARADADRQRAAAERSFGQAREGVDFLARVATEELADNPTVGDVRKEMLEAALDYYQGFVEDHGGDLAVGGRLSEAQARIAAILGELSAFDDFDRAQFRVKLLTEPAVRDSLALTDAQETDVRSLATDLPWRFFRQTLPNPESAAGGPATRTSGEAHNIALMMPDQRSRQFTLWSNELDTALAAALSASQFHRLSEVSRQVRGPAAFGDPDVARALAMTRAQRDAVRRVQAAYRKAKRDSSHHHGSGPGDREQEVQDAAKLSRDDAVREILAQLGGSQVAIWYDLAGPAFNGRLMLDRPPPDRPFRSPEPGKGPDSNIHRGGDRSPPPPQQDEMHGHRERAPSMPRENQ